jgi:hypothetical protein
MITSKEVKSLNSMNWKKKGIIFEPPKGLGWMVSHAAMPFAVHIGNSLRVYFSGRDEKSRAQIGWFEMDTDEPNRILRVSEQPVVRLGDLGAFDDSGVTNSCMIEHEGREFLYYSGWHLGVSVPFYFFLGLAVSDDGGETFYKISKAPILGRSAIDPYLTASPSILIENGVWRMWYVSGSEWKIRNDRPRHFYHIKYAESGDGIVWRQTGQVCIDYKDESEHAISRPCVVKDGNLYRMWYSCRGDSYRIGYAESDDGLRWERLDEDAGIDVSDWGWDSVMIEYPNVYFQAGKLHMLYNGNGYGLTGIGLAVSES